MPSEIATQFLDNLVSDLQHNRLVLPTLPEVALRIREAVNDDDASLTDIAKVIATDAALSAHIIQVANSPLLRASVPIQSLDMAVNRLGMSMVRDMATSIVMQHMFQATTDLTDKKLHQVWKHSMTVAAISHALAAQFTKLNAEEAMLAGLLHDIGTLPIISSAEDYPELLDNEAELDEVIRELHCKIGAAILKAWNFPEELVAVAAEHEDLRRDSPKVDYVDVVTVANLQSYMGTDHPLAKQDWSTIPAFAKLGLNHEVNVIEMEETAEGIKEVQRLLAS